MASLTTLGLLAMTLIWAMVLVNLVVSLDITEVLSVFLCVASFFLFLFRAFMHYAQHSHVPIEQRADLSNSNANVHEGMNVYNLASILDVLSRFKLAIYM